EKRLKKGEEEHRTTRFLRGSEAKPSYIHGHSSSSNTICQERSYYMRDRPTIYIGRLGRHNRDLQGQNYPSLRFTQVACPGVEKSTALRNPNAKVECQIRLLTPTAEVEC
ncbi:hypothetical protein Taro_011000, partial [Colocasia esculenta]|nr:hypothetical protein [Colocasia esculenta]